MSSPYFTIVIPTLNEEDLLPHLLNDLCKQTYKNFDVIVVDGKSLDNTVVKAQAFNKKLKIQVLSATRKNVSLQRNLGAFNATGGYIVFLDADCHLKSDFLRIVRKQTVTFSKLLIVPRIYPQDSDDMAFDKHLFPLINSIITLSQHSPKPFSSGGSMIVERHFFTFLGGFNPGMVLSEDHDVIHRAHAAGVIACVPKDLYIYMSLRRFHREGRLQVCMKYMNCLLYTSRCV